MAIGLPLPPPAQSRLELGLSVLGACVASNRAFAAQNLEDYQALCLPLLASELVGECEGSAVPNFLGSRLSYTKYSPTAIRTVAATACESMAGPPPPPLTGEAAFEAVRLLASCMPGKLGGKSLSLAASLRLVVRAQQAEAEAVSERKLQEAEAEAEVAAGAGGGFGAPGGVMRRPTVPPLRRGRTAAVRLRDLPKSPPVAEVMHALKEVSFAISVI